MSSARARATQDAGVPVKQRPGLQHPHLQAPGAAPSFAWWEWPLLAGVVVVAAALRWSCRDFELDDAYITYTYARSLAEGRGFEFGGVTALGTTTPLYALVLAGLSLLGASLPAAGSVLGMASGAAACALLYMLCRGPLGSGWAAIAAALLALNARHAVISVSGMETALYLATCLAALLAYQQGSARPALGLLAAALVATACLLRPDGLLLAAVIAAAWAMERRRQGALALAIAVLPLLAWAAYAAWSFGSPVPTSVTAKLAYPEYGRFRLEAVFASAGGSTPGLQLAAGLCAAGTLWVAGSIRQLVPLVAWSWLYVLAFLRAPNFAWYYVPPLAGLLVAAVVGAALPVLVVSRAPGREAWPGTLARVLSGAVAVWLLAGALGEMRTYRGWLERTYGGEVVRAYRGLARWVQRETSPGVTVAAPEVGFLGYYGGRKVLDLAGLCTPAVVPYLRERKYVQLIRDFQPEVVALTTEAGRPIHAAILDDRWFQATYRRGAVFPYRGSRYLVFVRKARAMTVTPVPSGRRSQDASPLN